MTSAARLNQLLAKPACSTFTTTENEAFGRIRATMHGWSDWRHWAFFRALAQFWESALPDGRPTSSARAALVLGVYQGMDIAIMRATGCKAYIIGVDKFSDTPCGDWPPENREHSWQTVGLGPAPNLAVATENLRNVGALTHTLLEESDDSVFLARCPLKFDFIYLDTAHDRATVERQLRQIRDLNLLTEDGVLAGDDYDNLEPTWGVRDAVATFLREHYLLAHRIWWCDAAVLRNSVERTGSEKLVADFHS